MLRSNKFVALASALLAAAASSTLPAGATPVTPATKAAALQMDHSNLQTVAWRGYGHHHGHWHGHGWGPGIIGGLVAGALIAGAIREGRANDADFERCEDRYRSFDRASGTYLGNDGERHVCPYLM